MKKIIILIILIACIFANGYLILLKTTTMGILCISALIMLTYIISRLKLESKIINMLIIYTSSAIYLTLYNYFCYYSNCSDVEEIILVMPSAVGILLTSINAVKIVKEVFTKQK